MFNKPHPNSILANADKATRSRIRAGQREMSAYVSSLEAWARNGFVSYSDGRAFAERDDA